MGLESGVRVTVRVRARVRVRVRVRVRARVSAPGGRRAAGNMARPMRPVTYSPLEASRAHSCELPSWPSGAA